MLGSVTMTSGERRWTVGGAKMMEMLKRSRSEELRYKCRVANRTDQWSRDPKPSSHARSVDRLTCEA
ncbi:hypothetical protein F2Q70_00038952 [Brassica cretica]|uniref:Uncharacterized protein n=1 Tax=Brassica cretica TaxID=69181 RepID=A0A3N6QPW6_BRACR|nr:hypothetical protein F2Q70_00038952 [Brassica cretica]KAF3493482.1 hypothetical protein DY000_02053349 [Brassica cretica]